MEQGAHQSPRERCFLLRISRNDVDSDRALFAVLLLLGKGRHAELLLLLLVLRGWWGLLGWWTLQKHSSEWALFAFLGEGDFFFRGHLFIHYLTLGQAALPGQDGRKLQMQAQHSIPSSKENSGHPTSVRLRQLAVVTAACPIPSHLHVSNVISLLIVMQWWRMQNFCQGSLFKPLNFQQPRNIRPTQTVVHMFNRVFTHKDKTPGPSKNRLICNTRALPPCYCVPPAFHHRWHCPWDPTWRGSLACPHHLHLRTYTQLVTKERGGDRGPCPTASGLFSWWHTYLVTKRVGGWERPMSHYQEPVLLCQTLFYVLIHKEDSKIINSIHFNCESVIQSMQFNCESML